MDIAVRHFENRADGYRYALEQLEALLGAETDLTAGLANASALIMLLLPDLNWAGFYRLAGDGLVLGPFQGKPAVSRIALGDGVCGTAAQSRTAQCVPDVHQCCNHIACDLSSASEAVLPLFVRGGLYGVLDLDSPVVRHFTEDDLAGLQPLAHAIEQWIEKTGA